MRDGLDGARDLREKLGKRADRPALLDDLLPALDGHGALVDLLFSALVPAPPTETANGGYIADGYDAALDELRRLAGDGVTPDELRRAVGQLSGGAALALEDSDTRMSRLGRAEISLGEFADLDESLRRLHLVTADDVRDLAADLAGRPVSISAVGSVTDDMFAGLAS